MKITLQEHSEGFAFDFTPETVADAAMLSRLALNCTKEVRMVQVIARRDHTIDGYLELGKRKNDTGTIKP